MALTLQQARAYVGQLIARQFDDQLYHGKVKSVKQDILDKEGVLWPLLFAVRYEDGDKEDLTPEQVQEALVNPVDMEHRLAELAASGGGAGAAEDAAAPAAGRRRQRGADDGGENDENVSATAVAGTAAHTKRRRVLGDATERSHNAGDERRSKRDIKRRVDDDFAYDEPRAAKRGAAVAGQEAAIRSRFGLRQPGQQAPGGAAQLTQMASESQVPYPVGEAGMRLTGLPGHPKSIECTNFMCHENFKMEFGEHVTFVSGTNGSGKSAVLQALQCCLGVKASNTGRANSFKKLIRTGADEAIIRVTVWNKPFHGFDAFRHCTFGDTITVERRIAHNASTYMLKDASGRVHGRKREDLDAMLQTLGVNAANPVCVMNQDTARNFLAGSSTKADQEKYQLYMEATSLDQIAYSLETSKAQIREMEENVVSIREEYDKMAATHVELRKSIAALEGIEGWRTEVEQLERVLMWAVVEDQAQALAQIQTALEGQLPAQMEEAAAKLEELQQEVAARREAVDGKAHFIASFNQRSAQLLGEVDALRVGQKEAHKRVRAADAKIRQLREALADAQAQKENLESAARETKDDIVAATQAQVSAYQRELEEAQAEEEACHREAAGVDSAYQQACAATKAAHQQAEDARTRCFATERRIQERQRDVVQIKEAGRSKLAAFGGQAAVRLVAAIHKAAGQFSRPPIGPVGQHLTLQDSRWGLAVEAAISMHLNAFLVHSMADSHLLRRMIGQTFTGQPMRPQVYVVNFDHPAHSIPPGSQPPPELPTIYRLLRCTDKKLAAPVLNNLVDTAHIEKIAVAGSRTEGERAGWQSSNVIACFTEDGQKYYRRGSTQTSLAAPYWLRGARLGQSAAQQVSELEGEVRRLQGELAGQQDDLQRAVEARLAADAAEREARKALQGAKKKEWAAKSCLTQLTQQPPPDVMAATQEDGGDAVQAEIWQAAQACIDLEHQLRERQDVLEQAQAAEQQAGEAHEEKKVALQRLQEENEQFTATYEQEARQGAEVEARMVEMQEWADDLANKQASWTRLAADKAAELAVMEEQAAQLCSREEAAEARAAVEARLRSKRELTDEQVAALLQRDMLGKKVHQLERKIAEHEKAAGGSLDELQARYAASQVRMNRDGRRFKEAIDTYKLVEDSAKLRTKKLMELDQSLEGLVNSKFRYYMYKKGHSGCIKLDRKARSLTLQVQMNSRAAGGGRGGGGGNSADVVDLKQLSGGERSYTTVAFTLALGGQTEMPFRAMDEFDVFMDAINRRVAMQNLFSFAKDNPELQFIFLSPQDMAAVEDARQACQQAGLEVPEGFVKVVQMKAPRANATHA